MKHAPKLILIGLVFALLLFALGSCRSIERASKSTLGGTALGIVLLFTPFSWAAIPVAALGGHIGGALQAGDDIKEEVKKETEKAVIKYVDREVVKWRDREVEKFIDVIPWWAWCLAAYAALQWIARFLSPRAREHIIGAVRDFLTLRWISALARAGAVEGVVHSETADRIAQSPGFLARRRLRREETPAPPSRPPTSQTSQEQGPHA